MKRVLLTGASGFIGRQAIPLLIERGYDMHAVRSQDHRSEPGVTWHTADLLDRSARRTLMEAVKPTHVLHLAWIATPGIYWTSPLNDDWKIATLDLLALAREHGAERFVGAGSCAEYNWTGDGHCDERSTPLEAATPYGQAKAATGQAVCAERGVSTAWARVFLLYGPHEHPKRLVSSVIRSLLQGERAACSHGAQIRDFLHVRDVAGAMVELLESGVTGPVNVASGVPVALREVVEEIGRQVGKSDLIDVGAVTPSANDPPRLTATVDRLWREVGWSPYFKLQEGLADTIDWWKAQDGAGSQ